MKMNRAKVSIIHRDCGALKLQCLNFGWVVINRRVKKQVGVDLALQIVQHRALAERQVFAQAFSEMLEQISAAWEVNVGLGLYIVFRIDVHHDVHYMVLCQHCPACRFGNVYVALPPDRGRVSDLVPPVVERRLSEKYGTPVRPRRGARVKRGRRT